MTDDTVHNPTALTRCIHHGRGQHHGGRTLGLGADLHNRVPVPSNDEFRCLRDDAEVAKYGLLDAREMADSARKSAAAVTEADERTRRGSRGWWSVYASLRLLRSLGPSRTSLHALVQDLVPVFVNVVDRGCRTLSRHRRAEKVRRDIRWQVSLTAPDIERRAQTHSDRYIERVNVSMYAKTPKGTKI